MARSDKKAFSKNQNHLQSHNTDVVQSYNFYEKERYRQLIAQTSTNQNNLHPNPYKKYIRTAPKQIFDDIILVSNPCKLRNISRRMTSFFSENFASMQKKE